MHKTPSVPDSLLGSAAWNAGMLGIGNHRTALLVHLEPGDWENEAIRERLTKLATSINRPDTIKCDLFTQWGEDGPVVPGFGTKTGPSMPQVPLGEWNETVLQSKYVLIANISINPNARSDDD